MMSSYVNSHHRHLAAAVVSLALLLEVRVLHVAAVDEAMVVYSFPALDDTTTAAGHGLVVTTTSSILSPATFLFDAQLFPELNRTEGFVLLARPVQLWGADADDDKEAQAQPVGHEASFNTSFTVRGGTTTPVAFVVLLDSFPPLASAAGLRGTTDTNDSSNATLTASDGVATVEVGAVGSYGPDTPYVGLNVTVTRNGTASSMTVWIEYSAATHQICVYVAAAGAPRPLQPLIDAPLDLVGRGTTQSAFVGFFASPIREVVVRGVRDWELAVDRFPAAADESDGESGGVSVLSTRLLVLLAVLGSVAVLIGVASVVVCWSLAGRRQEERRIEEVIKQVYPRPAARMPGRSGVGFVGT